MYNNERVLEKMKGLKALAERGVSGEKEAAQKMLEKFMQKYNISENDIGKETVEIAWFRYRDELESKLIHQIIYMVVGECDMYGKSGKGNRKHKVTGVYCTATERLEIELNFDFFKRAMQEELNLFYTAFIQKNKLFPPEEKSRESTANDEISEIDLFKLSFMMEGMERRTMKKMIECD